MSDTTCSSLCEKCLGESCAKKQQPIEEPYSISYGNDAVALTVYSVFPGIKMIYTNVHQSNCAVPHTPGSNLIEISHCREGRVECEYGGSFCYLTPGDISIARCTGMPRESYYPLSHFHGVTIQIDLDAAPSCLSCFLEDVTVSPDSIAEKFCTDRTCFIARSDERISHIFSELYSIPEEIRKGYFKVKVLELMLFLRGMELEADESSKRSCSRSHADLAKKICRHLTDRMDEHITISELTDIFHVSGTQIKNCFKAVYGISIYSYIRTQKMQSAAKMLRETDLSILEIAGSFGYENAGKFASAFCDVIGTSPSKYRNANKPIL